MSLAKNWTSGNLIVLQGKDELLQVLRDFDLVHLSFDLEAKVAHVFADHLKARGHVTSTGLGVYSFHLADQTQRQVYNDLFLL